MMLLCFSMHRFYAIWHTKLAIYLADNITFQAPRDLAFSFAFGCAFDYICLGFFVTPYSGDSNDLEGGIGFSIPAAI
jgi:hypothetical protein